MEVNMFTRSIIPIPHGATWQGPPDTLVLSKAPPHHHLTHQSPFLHTYTPFFLHSQKQKIKYMKQKLKIVRNGGVWKTYGNKITHSLHHAHCNQNQTNNTTIRENSTKTTITHNIKCEKKKEKKKERYTTVWNTSTTMVRVGVRVAMGALEMSVGVSFGKDQCI